MRVPGEPCLASGIHILVWPQGLPNVAARTVHAHPGKCLCLSSRNMPWDPVATCQEAHIIRGNAERDAGGSKTTLGALAPTRRPAEGSCLSDLSYTTNRLAES